MTVVDEINFEEQEPIFLKTFSELLTEMKTNEFGLIIGRVQTRNKTDYKKKYHHHFQGVNLIKILFRTMQLGVDQILRSRYHPEFPLTPKNPGNNEVIVGEVDFFLVSLEEQQRERDKDEPLIAQFIGSDYNYAIQPSFREEFKLHTFDKDELDIGLRDGQRDVHAGQAYDESGRCCFQPMQQKAYTHFCEQL